MFSVYFLLFLFCFANVLGLKKQICEYKDEDCLTQAVKQHAYAMFVAGVPGVEPSDPLNLDTININLSDGVYKLREPELTGFKDCQFKKLKLTQNDSYFDYEILCPHLTLQSGYQITKNNTEEKGNCEIIYNNYFIIIRGVYDKINDDNDKSHIHITSFTTKLDLQAGITYKFKSNASYNGKEKPDGYYKSLEEFSRQTVMDAFLNKYMDNLKAFLLAIPMEDLHFIYV